MTESLYVSCTQGLEAPLCQELISLGLRAKALSGGCAVDHAPAGSFVRVNVRSRLASRVSWELGHVDAPRALSRIRLAECVGPFTLAISEAQGPRTATPAEVWRNEAVKAWGAPAAGAEVQLRLSKTGASVSVDTSGDLLYLRGARQETGKAPLRETLAAGVLRLASWRPGEALWDLMCGSGTFLLEAGEQVMGLQPGRARHFAFEQFPGFDPKLLAEAQQPDAPTPTWLRGSDLNAGALGVTRRNAKRAGVLEKLDLQRLDATQLTRPEVAPGLVIANLPYGRRVGNRFELHGLYQAVGACLRRSFAGWRFAFLLQEGEDALGLPIDRTTPVRNGGLPCRVVTGRVT